MNSAFSVAASLLSVGAATPGFVFLIYSPHFENVTVMHSAGLAILLVALVLTLIVDSGMLSDFCLVLLRTSLSLAPILSYASGAVTWSVRTLIVVASFLTVPYDLENAAPGNRFPTARLPARGVVADWLRNRDNAQFRREDAGKAFVGILVSYLFLSPEAFMRPAPRIAACQATLVPAVNLLTVVNEAAYFHVATTPKKPDGR
jgi:hypothetical protein